MVKGVTFPSHAWGIQPITTHWIAGQSEHTVLFRTMSFIKIDAFQKGGAERSNNNVQYVEDHVFFYLKTWKHIALHKIMLFLASSHDPFKCILECLWLELKYMYGNATPAQTHKNGFVIYFLFIAGHCNLSRWQQSPKLEIYSHCYNRRTTRADSEKWRLGKWHGRCSHVLSNSTTG